MRQAADSAQEARQAEQEAMNGKANAAAEAANALQEAAKAIASAAHQPSNSSSAKSGEPHDPSQAKASSGEPSAKPGSEPGSKSSQPSLASETRGADVTGMARVDERPVSVKEIGISASDWVRLPPLVQQQLLSAAQQSGPPGYQDRIKKYFVKIANIQADGEGK